MFGKGNFQKEETVINNDLSDKQVFDDRRRRRPFTLNTEDRDYPHCSGSPYSGPGSEGHLPFVPSPSLTSPNVFVCGRWRRKGRGGTW